MPSDLDQNIVSSIMTGGHGSGIHNFAMAEYVRQVSFVDPTGLAKSMTRDYYGDQFLLFLNSFSTVGIVYELQLVIVEAYAV